MLPVPTDKKQLVEFAQELIDQCRVSVGARITFYRALNVVAETGRTDGEKSLINYMHEHLERTAAHLFSPVELKFALDFVNSYPAEIVQRGAVIAKHLTNTWDRQDLDFTFQQGVFEALKYGVTFLKQWVEEDHNKKLNYKSKLVMPWQFGVYREDETSLDNQTALCETSILTLPELWRRIYHLPNAKDLFMRARSHARSNEVVEEPSSFFHQVLSTSQLQTTGIDGAMQPLPGGIVQIGNTSMTPTMGPVIAPETVKMHELWVQDISDYTTIQFIEPDIVIAPLFKKANILVEGRHPYSSIQPNRATNWLWGRSELIDLVEPQMLLSIWANDIRRLFGLQIDKILGFVGDTGVTDESYGQFRNAGWLNLPQGSDIKDITPKMPPESIQMLEFVIKIINTLGSFPEIMQGKGEAGVRAGVHANTLVKMGSPTLRNRALLVERQCASAADLTLAIKEAKDPTNFWTKSETVEEMKESAFKITDLPEDWRVIVDSHSSSPIFADENQQLIIGGLKLGIVGPEYAIDNLPFPNKEAAKAEYKQRQKRKAQDMERLRKENPEVAEKVQLKQLTGSKR